jgi:hypothetical protein
MNKLWINNIVHLFSDTNIVPCEKCDFCSNFNRITKLFILFCIVLAFINQNTTPLYLCIVVICTIALLYFLNLNKKNMTEHFDNYGTYGEHVNNNYNNGYGDGYGDSYNPITSNYGGGTYYGSMYDNTYDEIYMDKNKIIYDDGMDNSMGYSMDNNFDNRIKKLYTNEDNNYVGEYNNIGINNNLPSPYSEPAYNYNKGPTIYRNISEIYGAPDLDVFNNDPVLREPSDNNPFMNVMPMDYGNVPVFDDYYRYEKNLYPLREKEKIKHEQKNNFLKNLYQDADGKLWDRLNSQRQYLPQPIGSVPNNQGEFAQWLYGSLNNCKAGSIWMRDGVKYTDDSLMCTGFDVATPTNQGFLN